MQVQAYRLIAKWARQFFSFSQTNNYMVSTGNWVQWVT